MRFVVYGAGAIGGAIGAGLHRAGHDVVLIARGAHLEALRERGLRVRTPDEDLLLEIPAVRDPEQAGVPEADVVVLAMKSQDTVAALERLAVVAPDAAVACAQNGIANEREALRRFARVYGVHVRLPAQHLTPGVVEINSAPVGGVLDLGRYPRGNDDVAARAAEALTGAGFVSEPNADIMRVKRAKLLGNLVNAVEVVHGVENSRGPVYDAARAEGVAAFAAAGLEVASMEEIEARAARMSPMRAVPGSERVGSSSSQSVARGTGTIETDYLNGEVVLLGRLHGVPTPVNAELQRAANRRAREAFRSGGSPSPR